MTQNQSSQSEGIERVIEISTGDLSPEILDLVRRALAEDIGSGDATTNSIVETSATAKVQIVAKQSGVIAGLDVARTVFLQLDEHTVFTPRVSDGLMVSQGQLLADVSGSARILAASPLWAVRVSQ